MMRNPDQLLSAATSVIDHAYAETGAWRMCPLFSGGHDSYSACFIASKHHRFQGNVYHIDTGIGSRATRKFVEEVCKDEGWKLVVLKSKATYERFIRRLGFPGPGAHSWIYHWIKDRCISTLTRTGSRLPLLTMLITGCRSQESVRRMGHVVPLKIGEGYDDKGRLQKPQRVWVSPCHDWSTEEQVEFMNHHRLLRNPVKESALGMSGECFCGAFARPGEIELIRRVCPDVADEIDRLTVIAKKNGTPHCWGERPTKIVEVQGTGMLCNSCEYKTTSLGIKIKGK